MASAPAQATRPSGAYAGAIRALAPDRMIEYRVFGQVTGALSRALRPDAPFPELAAALTRNMELWTVLLLDLSRPDNALPEDLRARLLSLGLYVRRQSEAALRREADAARIVEINTAIMRGLRGRRPPAEDA